MASDLRARNLAQVDRPPSRSGASGQGTRRPGSSRAVSASHSSGVVTIVRAGICESAARLEKRGPDDAVVTPDEVRGFRRPVVHGAVDHELRFAFAHTKGALDAKRRRARVRPESNPHLVSAVSEHLVLHGSEATSPWNGMRSPR